MSVEVWAPRAVRVHLHRAAVGDVEMRPATDHGEGWWRADVDLVDGETYGFVVDDELLADPRSRRQPEGVHALSAWDDPASFAWSDAAWTGRQLAGGIVYELHIGTFTDEGTLDAAATRLPALVELGITHVELLPVNAFNGIWNWGYDGVFWYAVHEPYGGPEAYRRFVDAAHALGLAVIQDVVYNHLGPSGNVLPRFGPYLRDGEANTWGDSVNLDEPAVRAYIIDNALMWLRDMHVDGLRLDAVHALRDDSDRHILAELSARVDALSAHVGRPLTLIAESDLNDPIMILPRETPRDDVCAYGLTAQWSDDWHHAVHVALTGETTGYYADFAVADALPKVWTRGFFHDGTYSSFRGRPHGHPIPSGVPTWRLVTFAQDHDQIGNRAAGDRLSAMVSRDRLAIAAVLTLTAPGTPMLFMGEEWGASTPWQFFTSHPEPELGTATAEGRVREFAAMGWDPDDVPDPQDPETYRRSILDWSERADEPHAALLETYRALLTLRRSRPEITDPSMPACTASVREADGGRVYVLGRGTTRVVVNLSEADFAADAEPTTELLFSTRPGIAVSEGVCVVPPETAVILGSSPG